MNIERIQPNVNSVYPRPRVEKVAAEEKGTLTVDAVVLEDHQKRGQEQNQQGHSGEENKEEQNNDPVPAGAPTAAESPRGRNSIDMVA